MPCPCSHGGEKATKQLARNGMSCRGDRRSPRSVEQNSQNERKPVMRLQNRVAVITGGAQGIGRAICLSMAREGARVVVADLLSEKANGVVAELQAIGTEAIAVEV